MQLTLLHLGITGKLQTDHGWRQVGSVEGQSRAARFATALHAADFADAELVLKVFEKFPNDLISFNY